MGILQRQKRNKKRVLGTGPWAYQPKKKNNVGNEFHLCTLNTRTLRTMEREVELDNALSEIKFSIIGLSEVRKQGENIIEKENGNILYYMGQTKGQKGVGFLVQKNFKQCIQEFVGINERIAIIKLSMNKSVITVIQVYAPTESSPEEEIEDFYEELGRSIDIHKTQRMFIVGDFNSKIGKGNEEETPMGPYGIGKRNDRGRRLIQFAEEHNLLILNTFYKKPPSGKWTWRSPDGRTKNEIDFILSDSKKNVKDVQVLNGLKFDSDHRMVRAILTLNKRKRYAKISHKPKLEKINKEIYKSTLKNNLEKLQNKSEDKVQEIYNQIQSHILQAVKTASLKEAGIRNKQKLSVNTIQLIEQREIVKQISSEDSKEYSEINKMTKRAIRKDVREYNVNLTRNILENSKSIKRIKKELGNGKYWMLGAKDEKGNTTKSRYEIVRAATNFYKQLYDSNLQVNKNDTQKRENEEVVPPILTSEVDNAITQLRNNRAPGDDGLVNECLKWGKEELTTNITDLFNKILTTEKIPEQWQTSTITLIHKKGNRNDLNNYRPISLLSTMYKLFTKILTNRISKLMDENQPPEQAGFRAKFSTIDHIHTISQIIEKTQEFQLQIYMAFIDFRKAFDSVEHAKIIDALEKINVHPKYIRLIREIYKNSKAKVRTEIEGEIFEIKRGVRQGDPISPKLFTCLLEIIFRKLNWNQKSVGLNINGRRLSNLRFADDIVLFARTAIELQDMMAELNKRSKEVGLWMNPTKTKIMTNSRETPITIDNTPIQYCNEYNYLGQTVSLTEKMEREIRVQRRISLAWGKFWGLKFILLDTQISTKLRLEALKTCVIPVIIYGSQTWTFTKRQTQTIQTCQRKMERKIIGIKLQDRIRNEELRKRSGIEDAAVTAKTLKWRWGGHVVRMDQERWAYATTVWDPRIGRRTRGRPRRRWDQDFKEALGSQCQE